MAIFLNALTCALAAALALFCTSAAAQSPASSQEEARFFTYENDSWLKTDYYYTSGIQYSVKRAGDQRGSFARAWTEPLCRVMGCTGWHLLASQANIGQLIYTPTDIAIRERQPHDRPWAGLLYFEQTYSFIAPDLRSVTTLTAQTGVTGPLSLAEPTQKLLHRLPNSRRPAGWGNEIGSSFGGMISAEKRFVFDPLSVQLGADTRLNTATYWRVAAGNMMTYAAGGIAVAIGKSLPTVSRQSAGIGDEMTKGGVSCIAAWLQCTAFGSFETRVVAYNLFLDGRLFSDDMKVRRRTVLHDVIVGVRFDLPRTRTDRHGPWFIQFKVARRSPEFKSWVPIPRHVVGALTIGTEF